MKINDGHYLELLDRLHVIMCNVEEHCIKHPISKKNKDIRFQLEYALGQLWDAYQQVGDLEDDKNKNPIEKVILRRHKKSKK
jgi:hypothetical protein